MTRVDHRPVTNDVFRMGECTSFRVDDVEFGQWSFTPGALPAGHSLLVDAITDVIRDHLERVAPVDAPFRELGWSSQAEHDAFYRELLALGRSYPPEVRLWLRDQWQAQGSPPPLSVEQMDLFDRLVRSAPAASAAARPVEVAA